MVSVCKVCKHWFYLSGCITTLCSTNLANGIYYSTQVHKHIWIVWSCCHTFNSVNNKSKHSLCSYPVMCLYRERDSSHYSDAERTRRRSRSYSPIRKRRRDSPSFMEARRITRYTIPNCPHIANFSTHCFMANWMSNIHSMPLGCIIRLFYLTQTSSVITYFIWHGVVNDFV